MQESDYKWFLDNYNALSAEHGIAYLAIKNKKVIGRYNSYAEGVREAAKTEEIGSFIVQKCDGTEAAYTNYISSMCFIA